LVAGVRWTGPREDSNLQGPVLESGALSVQRRGDPVGPCNRHSGCPSHERDGFAVQIALQTGKRVGEIDTVAQLARPFSRGQLSRNGVHSRQVFVPGYT